jgi:DNA mismatch repair protein MSH3
MVPMQRRQVYLKKFVVMSLPSRIVLSCYRRLLSKGYKVGLVEQMETRALKKAGANKNTPFKRAVNQIYTAATYVDELGSEDNEIAPTLMCVVEKRKGVGRTNERVTLGVVVVCPTSGEVVWDHFEGKSSVVILYWSSPHLFPSQIPECAQSWR